MPLSNIELKNKTQKPYASTDPKMMEVPTHPSQYALCFFPCPEGLDLGPHMQKFAEEALAKGLKRGEASDLWYETGKKLIETFEAGKSSQRQASAYGADVSLSPDEAENEIQRITRDKNHPYNNDKMLSEDRTAALAYVNRLYEIKSGLKSNFAGYLDEYHSQRREKMKHFESNMRKTSSDIESFTQRYNSQEDVQAETAQVNSQEPSV